ncbi:MAG: hypothetical protein WDN69_02400 [Aliidongia sp.]
MPGFTRPLPLVAAEQVAEIREYFLDKPYLDPYRDHLGEFRFPAEPSPREQSRLLRSRNDPGCASCPATLQPSPGARGQLS